MSLIKLSQTPWAILAGQWSCQVLLVKGSNNVPSTCIVWAHSSYSALDRDRERQGGSGTMRLRKWIKRENGSKFCCGSSWEESLHCVELEGKRSYSVIVGCIKNKKYFYSSSLDSSSKKKSSFLVTTIFFLLSIVISYFLQEEKKNSNFSKPLTCSLRPSSYMKGYEL